MLRTNFQATESSCSEEDAFKYFPLYFYDSNDEYLGRGNFGSKDLYLKKLGKMFDILWRLHFSTHSFCSSVQSC